MIDVLKTWRPSTLNQTARTFPAEMYLSGEIYRLEVEQIFGRTWCYVGHLSQLDATGSYFTVEIANQPLVIVRDRQGTLRAFFNVCPHRAAPLATGSGTCHRLTCTYHAWSFELDGSFHYAPDMETAEGFERPGLAPVQVDTWGPFIFVNLDPQAAPLRNQLGELPDLFQNYRFSEWVRVHSVDYYTDTNWKLYVENNVESYHEFSVHASIARYYKATTAEARNHYYLQYARFSPNDEAYRLADDLIFPGLGEVERNGKSTMSLFPNFAWIIRPWIAIIYLIDPQGRSRTHIRWDWLVPNTEAARAAANVEPLIQFF